MPTVGNLFPEVWMPPQVKQDFARRMFLATAEIPPTPADKESAEVKISGDGIQSAETGQTIKASDHVPLMHL
jgi:hypothetical protein